MTRRRTLQFAALVCLVFHLAADTRLGLEEIPPGQSPSIARDAIKVAPFDRDALEARQRVEE